MTTTNDSTVSTGAMHGPTIAELRRVACDIMLAAYDARIDAYNAAADKDPNDRTPENWTALQEFGRIERDREFAMLDACKHPATRVYAWVAYDGTLCAGCCDCGKALAGGVTV